MAGLITILEARKIALDILAHAEQERLLFAEAEAQRGIDWEHRDGKEYKEYGISVWK